MSFQNVRYMKAVYIATITYVLHSVFGLSLTDAKSCNQVTAGSNYRQQYAPTRCLFLIYFPYFKEFLGFDAE